MHSGSSIKPYLCRYYPRSIMRKFSFYNLFFHPIILYPPTHECNKIIWEAHSSKAEDHFFVHKTLIVLQKYFCWFHYPVGMEIYIKRCVSCVSTKLTNMRQGLYTPLSIPFHPWESISVDFLWGSLITFHHHNAIFGQLVLEYGDLCAMNRTLWNTYSHIFGYV